MNKNYIHHAFIHYNGLGIPHQFDISEAVQSQIEKKKSNFSTTNPKITLEASELIKLITEEGGIDKLLSDVIKTTNEELNKGLDFSKYEKMFSFEGQKSENLFSSVDKILGENSDILIFKKQLEEVFNTISKTLGYDNYGELGKLILINIKKNYGTEISEKIIVQDFIANCNNKKFTVNKEFANQLTTSLNRIYLLIKSLPILEKTGNLNYKIRTISELANKSVGWVTNCSDILKQIAMAKLVIMTKHHLAVGLNNDIMEFNQKNKDFQIEFEGEIKDFIESNLESPPNFSKEINGVLVKVNEDFVEISVDMTPNYNPLKKSYRNFTDIPNIKNTKKLVEIIEIMDGLDIEGLMNLSGSHAKSATEESDIQMKFNDMELGIARNAIIQELINTTQDEEVFLIDGELFEIKDIIHFVTDKEGKIKVKLSMDRKNVVKNNRWEDVYQNDWDNAYLRSSKNELLQHANMMTYEYNIQSL